jgi:hypothetical protein
MTSIHDGWTPQPQVETEEQPQCLYCDATENLTWAPDPYAHEIHDDDTPMWLCDNCRQELRDEI